MAVPACPLRVRTGRRGVEEDVKQVEAVVVPAVVDTTRWFNALALRPTKRLKAPEPLAVVVAVLRPPLTLMFALAP